MNAPAIKLESKGPLRVAIDAGDPARRTALSRLVVEAGHTVVDDCGFADVVLADGKITAAGACPTVAIGGTDPDLPGILSRTANASQLDAALRGVAAGLIVRSPDAGDDGFKSTPERELHALLTPREIEVLAAIADGDTNKAIARRLNISLHTVKFHVESVFRKLGVRTRAEAVGKAAERRRNETIVL